MTSVLKGTLIIDVDGRCVTVDGSATGQPPIPVVFVHGTILVPGEGPGTGVHILLPDGQRLSAGDTLEIVGGTVDLESVPDIDILAHLTIPETCWSTTEGDRELWLTNPNHPIVVLP